MAGTSYPDVIPAGFDLLRTTPGGAIFKFKEMPIPPDFFGRGSESFEDTVEFRGRPLPPELFRGQEITHVDTVVQRKVAAEMKPPYPCSCEVPIEIVGLALESVEPIRVRVRNRTELWDVQAEVSTSRASEGSMIITKTRPDGGVFDSTLMLIPLLKFTRRCDGKERTLDVGAVLPMFPAFEEKLVMRSSQTPWLHDAPYTLKIRGLNDNFVAGAPDAFAEEGLASIHNAEEPPDVDVQITGISSTCLTLGRTRSFTASGSPAGGTYSWTITQGASRASIVGVANAFAVTVRGEQASGAANDITLLVQYQAPEGGNAGSASVQLTTIQCTLDLRSSGTLDTFNQAEIPRDPVKGPKHGFPNLGPVSPNNPPGCDGFWKNIEVEAQLTPADAVLSCKLNFRRIRRGLSGTRFPDGTFIDEGSCFVLTGCGDDPSDKDEDLTLSPIGTIYVTDGPGLLTGTTAACSAAQAGVTEIHCMDFTEWLEVDDQQCGPDILWHAETRIQCQGGTWVEVASSVGPGHIGCTIDLPVLPPLFSVSEAVELIEADPIEDRVRGYKQISDHYRLDQLSDDERAELVPELIRVAVQHGDQEERFLSLTLAIELLGLLQASEGIPVLMEHVQKEFDSPFLREDETVASKALVRIGHPAIPAIINKAQSATETEWPIFENVLLSLGDQPAVHKEICGFLDSCPGDVAEKRLSQYILRIANPKGLRGAEAR